MQRDSGTGAARKPFSGTTVRYLFEKLAFGPARGTVFLFSSFSAENRGKDGEIEPYSSPSLLKTSFSSK